MKRLILFSGVFTLILASLMVLGFTDQNKPKKKPAKKATSSKTAESNKIVWYNMSDGYALAQKTKKMIVVDVYTDWCYWCKVMDKNTYENANVIKKMNKHFIAVKFNPENNGNHVVNGQTMSSEQLATYLNKGGRIPGYPMTFVWKDIKNQSTLAPYSGYLDTTQFNAIMNKMIQDNGQQ